MKRITCSCGGTLDVSKLGPGSLVRCTRCRTILKVPPAETKAARVEAKTAATVAKAPPARPARTPATPGRGVRAIPPKRSNRMLLIGSAAGLVILVGVFFLLNNNRTSAPPPTETDRGKNTYQKILDLRQPKDAKGWFDVAQDCKANGLQKEYEENVEKAAKMDPANTTIAGAFMGLAQSWLLKLDKSKPDYADEYFKIAERIEGVGLKRQADDLYADIAGEPPHKAGFAPTHPGANKKLNRVLTAYGTYEDKDLYEDTKKRLEDLSKRDAELKKLDPWHRKAFLKHEDIEKTTQMKFTVKAQPPYLVAVQDSDKYISEVQAEDFRRDIEAVYNFFKKEYAEKFKIQEVFDVEKAEEVFPVIVYDSSETYHKIDPYVPPWAGGGFSYGTGDIQMYNGTSDPIETILHEGTHQLVAAATRAKGKKDTNTYWFTEGVACFSEAWTRDAVGEILLKGIPQQYLNDVQQAQRAKKLFSLEGFLAEDYGSFMIKQRKLDGFKLDEFVRLHYAQSWAIVYFLRNYKDGKYRDKFDEYFRREISGAGGFKAFKEIFGDVAVMEKEWAEYVRSLKQGG